MIVVLGAAVVYVNLTFERATGPEVEVEAVERRYLEAIVSAPGTIVPQLTVDISANTMGRVTRLEFDEGQRVGAGDFLLEIDPETLRAAVDRGEGGAAGVALVPAAGGGLGGDGAGSTSSSPATTSSARSTCGSFGWSLARPTSAP